MKRIAVVMGGPSAEHDISISSGSAAIENLDKSKYLVTKIVISKTEKWQFENNVVVSRHRAIDEIKKRKIEVVFIALHGTFGEDGQIQQIFEDNDISYTGTSSIVSALAMDKVKSNKVYTDNGLSVPKTLVLGNDDPELLDKVVKEFKFPVFIKPVSQGSSVGAHLVKEKSQLAGAVKDALNYDHQVMVQNYIKGREFSCGILEKADGQVFALPPTELIPVISEFFDYQAKYTKGGTKEITPPQAPDELIAKLQKTAVQVHKSLGCRGYSRTDTILDEAGQLFIIETNTLPGLTPTSILPQQAAAADISFSDLLDMIIVRADSKKI